MKNVRVKTGSKDYSVLIGKNILENAGALISDVIRPCRAAVITDDTVDALYSQILVESIEKAGFDAVKFVFPHGESSKTPETYLDILEFLGESRITRTDLVIALGGGVTGDMAGFAASTFLRGVHLVQIPTTLLSAVDSSVGGKTAIDLKSGKNQAGTFYQPDLVICDYATLDTLPEETFSEGCAEIIKYGMIWDRNLFDSMSLDVHDNLEEIIARCVEIKRDVVSQDEHDTGLRQILNFGHTFGHGIEKASSYRISHGNAVAMGMAIVTKASGDDASYKALLKTLAANGLPSKCPYSTEELFDGVLSDKKRTGETITLVLPEGIGKVRLEKMSLDDSYAYLEKGLE